MAVGDFSAPLTTKESLMSDDQFSRELRRKRVEAERASLKNDMLMKALTGANDIGPWKTQVNPVEPIGPWKTRVIPGDPGAFASPQPLNYPGSMAQQPNNDISNNIIQQLIGSQQPRMQLANNQSQAPAPPPPINNIIKPPIQTRSIEEIMNMLKGGDRTMRSWWTR